MENSFDPTALVGPRLDDPIADGIAEGARNIFVNRNLDLTKIHLVGFDMDYTLAIYFKREIEELAFNLTVEQLVKRKGYPEAIASFRYDPNFAIRGLILDKRRGNLLKIDRFKVVGRATHGTKPMASEAIPASYERKILAGAKEFVSIDTLFSLPEANLFAMLVDYFDAHEPVRRDDYSQLFDDIKWCIDTIHNDGSLKGLIALDVPKYIYKDPYLALALDKLRKSGKKLFLLTNSYWEYTNLVMTYLLDGELPDYGNWREYFDFIGVGARKPDFFVTDSPFWVVDPTDESLSPFEGESFDPGLIYQHGNAMSLEKLSGYKGEAILYVGDHIFGDILRSNKNGGWRAALVIQELEEMLHRARALRHERDRLTMLEELRQKIDREILLVNHKIGKLQEVQDPGDRLQYELQRLHDAAGNLTKRLDELVQHIIDLETQIDTAYHPSWGEIFTELGEISRFGDQVRDFACIYTSRVSNFLLYPEDYTFKAMRERMAHEKIDLAI